MVCTASQIALIVGIIVGLLAISTPISAALLWKLATTDLADIRRQISEGGLRGLLFRLGYPLIWFIYLPRHGFFFTLSVALLLMLPAYLFC